jgi:hypothetical protein
MSTTTGKQVWIRRGTDVGSFNVVDEPSVVLVIEGFIKPEGTSKAQVCVFTVSPPPTSCSESFPKDLESGGVQVRNGGKENS